MGKLTGRRDTLETRIKKRDASTLASGGKVGWQEEALDFYLAGESVPEICRAYNVGSRQKFIQLYSQDCSPASDAGTRSDLHQRNRRAGGRQAMTGKVYYSLHDRLISQGYTDVCGEWVRTGPGRVEVTVWEWPVIKRTPKGAWVGYGEDKHWCRDGPGKRFAYRTIEEAIQGYWHRKRRQVEIYSAKLANAERAKAIAEGLKNGDYYGTSVSLRRLLEARDAGATPVDRERTGGSLALGMPQSG